MLDWLKRSTREELAMEIGCQRLPLAIRRLGNARRMTLRLAPDGSEIRVSMPRWGRTADALAFANSRADWLARQLEALPAPEVLAPGGRVAYRGGWLAIDHAEKAPRRPRLEGDAIRVGGPADAIQPRIQRWLEREALPLLSEDLIGYCARAGRPAPRLALSRARRRWGSCAADGSIRINWRLVMAPDAVRRSVVAHEVAHLVHFDHSPQFHAMLADLFEGDIKQANRWLKQEGRRLYTPFG